jgi:GTP-binding protein Era
MDRNKSKNSFVSGFAAIAGPPNAGKSTLLNALLGTRVAIVTAKPHTTRNQIRGILTKENFQVIFVDTPGFHEEGKLLNRMLSRNAVNAIEDVDLVMVVLDCARRRRKDEKGVLEVAFRTGKPVILVLNKVDKIDRKKLLPAIAELNEQHDFAAVVPISAKKGTGVQDLLDEVRQLLPQGPPLYDAETVTDQPTEQIVAEIIREKIFLMAHQEIPYSTAVTIESMTEENNRLVIRAVILVDRPSQKGVIVGRGGQFIKRTGVLARQDIQKYLGRKVHLELWVKVAREWSKNPRMLSELGITEGG